MRISTPSNPNVTVSGTIATQYAGLLANIPAIVDNADGQAPVGANGLIPVLARLEALNLASTAFNRVHSGTMSADGLALAVEALITACQMAGFNGATWDRVRADNIGGAGSLRVSDRGYAYGDNYTDTSAMLANTSIAVFTPVQNVNGAILWEAQGMSANATGPGHFVLAAHTAPPNAVGTGRSMAVGTFYNTVSTQFFNTLTLGRAVFVPAGFGLYFTVDTAESAAHRMANYTLL